MKLRMVATFLFVGGVVVCLTSGTGPGADRSASADLAFAAPAPRPLSDAPWTASVKVSDDPGTALQGGSSLAVDLSGNAYAAWSDQRNNHDIYFSYRPAGGSWGSNVKVNDDPGSAYQWAASVAADPSGNAYAAWNDQRRGSWDVYFSYRPVGGSWGSNVKVNDGPGNPQVISSPSIAVDQNGNAYGVWEDHRNGNSDIYFSHRPAGGSWAPNIKLNDDAGTADQDGPSIAVDPSGNAYAVWNDHRNGNSDIYFSYRPAGGSWAPNIKLNDDAGTAEQYAQSIAVDPSGAAYAVWQDERNDYGDIYFSYRPAGGSWGSNVRVNDVQQRDQASPSIAVDPNGNAYTTWSDYRNYNYDIYFSYRPGGGPGLTVSHIEVTQAIQDQGNSVPLIEGKPTFVRVYVDCGTSCTSLPNVTGVLRGYGPSGELAGSPLAGVSRFITAQHEAWTNQRGDLKKTLNFTLPPVWSTGTVTLRAEVRGATRSEVVIFKQARAKNIIYLPVRYNGQEPTSRIDDAGYWARRVWPVADINYIRWPAMEWSAPAGCLRYVLDAQAYSDCLSEDLKNRLTGEYWKGHVGGYIFGWLPDSAEIGVGGSSDPTWYGGVGKAAFGLDEPTQGPRIFAHEVGHLMGRRHTNTGECVPPDVDPDTDWPYGSAQIQDYGIDGYGFGWLLSSSSAVKNPTNTYDYMSYCGSLGEENVWTSPWTYEHLYSEALQLGVAGMETPLLSGLESYLISSGLVYTDDAAILDPIWVISPTVTPENPPEGTEYCLEAQDGSNVALVSRCFDLAFVNYETGEPTNVDGFNLMLPYPSGVARIVLRKGTTELAVQPVSSNAPAVTVVSPNGGETWAAGDTYDITWSASDADGDPLTYSVMYSTDGSDWIPVGGTVTETQGTVNSGELAGSATARVRVLASDGVNTSEDQSDGVFTVGGKPPQVSILSPEGSIGVVPGTPILLQGYAYDLEDGVLEGASLEWSSDRDGPLGTGSQVLVILSRGQHTISFTAEDTDANAVTATVDVHGGYEAWVPVALKRH